MRPLLAVVSLCTLIWTAGCGAVESLVGGRRQLEPNDPLG